MVHMVKAASSVVCPMHVNVVYERERERGTAYYSLKPVLLVCSVNFFNILPKSKNLYMKMDQIQSSISH